MHRTRVIGALAAAALTATGCGGDGGGVERGDADTAIEVTLRDFAFDGLPATAKGPAVYFSATNAGPATHELEILDSTGKAVDEVEALAAGGKAGLGVRLKPGTYTIQCILTTPEGKVHAELGMTRQLRIE